jgi:hypothetical protein
MKLQIIDPTDPAWMDALHQLRHDFYHLPDYVGLEASRMHAVAEAVLIQDGEAIFFLPYLLRRCSDLLAADRQTADLFDLVSPYGYAGMLWNPAASAEFIRLAMAELIQTLRQRGVCSAFLRLHPILNHQFVHLSASTTCQIHSETIAVDLTQSQSEIWHQTRPEHRNKINKCKRAGFTATMMPLSQCLEAFLEIYTETMNRVAGSSFYYFSREYFVQFAAALGEKLHVCLVAGPGTDSAASRPIACAGLFTECGQIVQYHLGGTRSEFLKRSPSTLMFDYVRAWARERGNEVLHLGGGVGGAQDSLYHFKAGFSPQRYPLPLLRLIIDPDRYHDLVEVRAKSLNVPPTQLLQTGFFPAYRSLSTG